MIILVYVVEASGLKYPNDKIIATASLGQNVLETKLSSPRNTTRFESSLAWRTDLTSIKRMKSANIPIKVECFSVSKDGLRELIGFVVVPLRSVAILAGNKVLSITPKWHRLIGLRYTWKTDKPEILLFTTITDIVGAQFINEMRNTSSTVTKNMLNTQEGIYIGLNKTEHHIQIGDSPLDCNRFTVEIRCNYCEWLSYLTDNPSSEQSFQMRYTFLDCPTAERNLPKMCGTGDEERYMVQEKITIQLRSSLQMMRRYFESVFYIPIYIYCKQEILGRAFLKIVSALPDTNDLNEFLLLTKDNTFVAISESIIYPTKSNSATIDVEHQPSLKYILTLKYHHSFSEEIHTNQLHLQSNESTQKIEHYQQNGYEEFSSTHKIADTVDRQYSKSVAEKDGNPLMLSDTEVVNHLEENVLPTSRDNVEESIERRNKLIQRLRHSNINPWISPKNRENIRFADIAPPTPRSYFNMKSPTFPKGNFKDAIEPRDEIKSYFSEGDSPIVEPQDDLLMWKAKEQELFLMRLRQKENERLKSLSEEWFNRQNKEKKKLSAKMNKCKILTQALEQALKGRKFSLMEKKPNLLDHQKLTESTHLLRYKDPEDTISDLKDKLQQTKLEQDFQLKEMVIELKETQMCNKLTENENIKLKISVKKLEDENQLLREQNRDLDTNLSRKLQTAEMKLMHAQELELFYKNLWTTAEEKLNKLQMTNQAFFSHNGSHLSACVVDVLNSVRSDLEADIKDLKSIKDMLN